MSLAIAIILVIQIVMMKKWYKKPASHEGIIRIGFSGKQVSFGAMMVVPVLHKMEKVDVGVKLVHYQGGEEEGLKDKTGNRLQIDLDMFVRINQDSRDVLNAASSIGAKNTFDAAFIQRFFEVRLIEASRAVLQRFSGAQLATGISEVRIGILEEIGRDLNGYMLEDIAIRSLKLQDELAVSKPD